MLRKQFSIAYCTWNFNCRIRIRTAYTRHLIKTTKKSSDRHLKKFTSYDISTTRPNLKRALRLRHSEISKIQTTHTHTDAPTKVFRPFFRFVNSRAVSAMGTGVAADYVFSYAPYAIGVFLERARRWMKPPATGIRSRRRSAITETRSGREMGKVWEAPRV